MFKCPTRSNLISNLIIVLILYLKVDVHRTSYEHLTINLTQSVPYHQNGQDLNKFYWGARKLIG